MHFLFRILLIQLNEQTGNDWRRGKSSQLFPVLLVIVSCIMK